MLMSAGYTGIVEGCAIQTEFELVEQVRPKQMLQGDNVVPGMVCRAHLIEEVSIWSAGLRDVSLRARVECGAREIL